METFECGIREHKKLRQKVDSHSQHRQTHQLLMSPARNEKPLFGLQLIDKENFFAAFGAKPET